MINECQEITWKIEARTQAAAVKCGYSIGNVKVASDVRGD